MTETEFIDAVRDLKNELGIDYDQFVVALAPSDEEPTVTIEETGPVERGTLIIGPWDEPPTWWQEKFAATLEWLASAHADYHPDAYFDVRLFGGVIRVRENGDVFLNVRPIVKKFPALFDWLWDKGLP